MWTRSILGTDFYHLIMWFLTYSILGWIVESIYMSICNRKITNRGFMFGPMCPIYGIGALTVYFMLRRFSDNYLILYLVGCVVPTILEYLTARVMLLVFHEVWWDYTNKPFNYKGILCLESTLAWGLYTVGLFAFLHKGVTAAVEYVPFTFGIYVATVVLAVEGVDFLYHLIQAKTDALPHNVKELRESLRVFR